MRRGGIARQEGWIYGHLVLARSWFATFNALVQKTKDLLSLASSRSAWTPPGTQYSNPVAISKKYVKDGNGA